MWNSVSFARRATNLLGRKSSQFLDYKQGRRKSTAVKTELVLPRPTISMRRRCCTLGSEEPCGRSTSPLRTECASRSYKWHFGAEWCLTSSQLLVGRLRNTLQGPRLPVVINGEAPFGIATIGWGRLECYGTMYLNTAAAGRCSKKRHQLNCFISYLQCANSTLWMGSVNRIQ